MTSTLALSDTFGSDLVRGIGAILLMNYLRWTFDRNLMAAFMVSTIIAIAPAIVQGIAAFTVPMRMLRGATHCSTARLWTMGAILPLAWALLATVIAIGLPLAYVYVGLIVLSVG